MVKPKVTLLVSVQVEVKAIYSLNPPTNPLNLPNGSHSFFRSFDS